jgi:hypothetical protein
MSRVAALGILLFPGLVSGTCNLGQLLGNRPLLTLGELLNGQTDTPVFPETLNSNSSALRQILGLALRSKTYKSSRYLAARSTDPSNLSPSFKYAMLQLPIKVGWGCLHWKDVSISDLNSILSNTSKNSLLGKTKIFIGKITTEIFPTVLEFHKIHDFSAGKSEISCNIVSYLDHLEIYEYDGYDCPEDITPDNAHKISKILFSGVPPVSQMEYLQSIKQTAKIFPYCRLAFYELSFVSYEIVDLLFDYIHIFRIPSEGPYNNPVIFNAHIDEIQLYYIQTIIDLSQIKSKIRKVSVYQGNINGFKTAQTLSAKFDEFSLTGLQYPLTIDYFPTGFTGKILSFAKCFGEIDILSPVAVEKLQLNWAWIKDESKVLASEIERYY